MNIVDPEMLYFILLKIVKSYHTDRWYPIGDHIEIHISGNFVGLIFNPDMGIDEIRQQLKVTCKAMYHIDHPKRTPIPDEYYHRVERLVTKHMIDKL